MNDMDPARSALLVMDLQTEVFARLPSAVSVVERTAGLIAARVPRRCR